MARTWLSIRVELVGGMHAHDLWPRPGRLILARPGMTFRMLADTINEAFARWDRAHLHAFTFADGTRIVMRTPWDEDDGDLDDTEEKLTRLELGERFAFEFDFGDSWMHLCTVEGSKVDPAEVYGATPDRPVPYFGWGDLPDQYGRRWDGDDGESPPPPQPDPPLSDLPDLHYTWGSRAFRMAPPSDAGSEDTGSHGAEGEVVAGPWSGSTAAHVRATPAPRAWTREDVRELRGAVHRRDADVVVDLLASRPAIEVAHLAAPALLRAAEHGDDRARLLTAELMAELPERGWTGDDDLVDEFRRVVMDVPSDLRPIPIELDELATHLDGPTDMGEGWVLELATGQFWPSDPVGIAGVEEPEGFDDPDRFISVTALGSRRGYGDMREFIATLDDEHLADRLRVAIEGKGAFRRFKNTVGEDDEALTAWLLFSSERQLARARWWFADAGFRPTTDPPS